MHGWMPLTLTCSIGVVDPRANNRLTADCRLKQGCPAESPTLTSLQIVDQMHLKSLESASLPGIPLSWLHGFLSLTVVSGVQSMLCVV